LERLKAPAEIRGLENFTSSPGGSDLQSTRRNTVSVLPGRSYGAIHQPVPFDQLHHPRLMLGAAELHDARGPQLDRDLRLVLAVALEQDSEHNLAHPEVLSFAIHSDPLIIRQIKSFNKGAIMDGLNLGIIRKLEINLPPMEDRLRFVAMLRKARAIEARSQTPAGSGEDLFQSLSQRAFRGEL